MKGELLKVSEVMRITGHSRSLIYKLMKDRDNAKNFPLPEKIGKRLYWRNTDIQRYIKGEPYQTPYGKTVKVSANQYEKLLKDKERLDFLSRYLTHLSLEYADFGIPVFNLRADIDGEMRNVIQGKK